MNSRTILISLFALPGAAAGVLLRPSVARVFRKPDAAKGRPALVIGLVIHFYLVAVLLAGASVAPPSFGEPRLLLGPWLISGLAARLVSAIMAAAHLGAGVTCWLGGRSAYAQALWLNIGITVLAAVSGLTAGRVALESLGAGLLPAGVVRALLGVATALGLGLIVTVRAARTGLSQDAMPPGT